METPRVIRCQGDTPTVFRHALNAQVSGYSPQKLIPSLISKPDSSLHKPLSYLGLLWHQAKNVKRSTWVLL
jgi:hypothetical protein